MKIGLIILSQDQLIMMILNELNFSYLLSVADRLLRQHLCVPMIEI